MTSKIARARRLVFCTVFWSCVATLAPNAWLAQTFAQQPANPKAESGELSPDMPYAAKRGEEAVHEVEMSVVITPPYNTKVLRVWLPLPPSDFAQEVTSRSLTSLPMSVTPQISVEPAYGNRFAYFEFQNPQGAQIVRHQFQAKIWNLDWNVAPEQVTPVTVWPRSFAQYLQPQKIEDKTAFENLLGEIVPRRRTPGEDLTRVMRWIDANLKYDHADASLRADANHALSKRHGHCSDYHGLCATMGRALGQPTRVTYGLAMFPKNSPSHCKLEAFLPPYGWVSYDLSETQKLTERIATSPELAADEKRSLIEAARARLIAGRRENSWLLVTRGRDYELSPKASRPVNVVRTIYAEADGEPLPDPDPANPQAREFAWMTVMKFGGESPQRDAFHDLPRVPRTRVRLEQ